MTVTSLRLLLSTDKEQPFKVRLYNDNVLVQEFTLSKNQPVDFEVPDDSQIRSSSKSNTMKPSSMGYHLAGEKSFYASLRLYGQPISEMITSKGKTAAGTHFFVVNDQSILYDEAEPNGTKKKMMNYQASIMALEDNTKIKVSNYDKRLVFANGDASDELNFILNKGQSYIVAAVKSDNPTPNNPIPILDDNDPNLIGAQITSDKNIVVTNGNFLSQNLGDIGSNINLDQSLPVSRIGKEYFIANGLTFADGFMEKTIMVATEDNTQVYVNDETVPVVTLKKGEYFIGPGPRLKKFISSSQPSFTNSVRKTIETKGMYLRASKPIYMYQMIGGFQDMPIRMAPDQTPRTSAMMLSYPLDKDYFPDTRQHLSNTLVIPKVHLLGGRLIDTKITLKTENGANIKINNVPMPAGDFSPIPGKSGWSYWSRFQLTGDVIISSDKSLNVDYTGGYVFSGIAGSFTGYSNDPFIIKNGNCIQESVSLTLNNTDFNSFQWQLNGVDIAGANSSFFNPQVPGDYTCVLTYMDFTYTTDPVSVANCPYTVSTRVIGAQCGEFLVQPSFSAPNQNSSIVRVDLSALPVNGTASFDGTVIRVIPKVGFAGNDRLIYKVTGSTGFYETVKVEFNVLAQPIGDIKLSILPQAKVDPNYYFNLPSIINNYHGETFEFYENVADAKSDRNKITDVLNYDCKTNKWLCVKITNAAGCSVIKDFQLVIPPVTPTSFSLFNTFSPNADGVNDVWDYSILEKTNLIELKIFNRHGRLVHEFLPLSKYCWNGRDLSNTPLETGTYWVVYTYVDAAGAKTSKNQWILLKNF